jgi:hypothetical protein
MFHFTRQGRRSGVSRPPVLEALEDRFLPAASPAATLVDTTGSTALFSPANLQAQSGLALSLAPGAGTSAVQGQGIATQATPVSFTFTVIDQSLPPISAPSAGVPFGFPGRVVLPGTGVTERAALASGPFELSPGQYLSGGGGNNGLPAPANPPAPPPPPPPGMVPLAVPLDSDADVDARDLALTTFVPVEP